MKYCYQCATKLELRACADEGLVQFCTSCKVFRLPIFNAAISAAVFTKNMDKLLLIQQYGKTDNILVA